MPFMLKRLFYAIFCLFHRDSADHARYLKKRGLFGSIGENCRYQSWFLPYDAKRIFLHDNVCVAANAHLICHDGVSNVLNNMVDANGEKYKPCPVHYAPIEIYDNVFISSNSIVYPGAHIGPNAIVSAGSVVTGNVPPNSVVAGNPAKVIGSFSVMEKMRRMNMKF